MPILLLAALWGHQINVDTAWYLVATRDWLDGARLYVDLFEINPPLNFYLTVPPILLSDLIGISAPNAQYVVLCLAIFLSLLGCQQMIPSAPEMPESRRNFFLFGLGIALIAPAMNDVGQREHVMVILTAPWLVSLLPRHRPLPLGNRLLLAAIAALGICLKPYFVLIPAAVTLWLVVSSRSLRPILSAGNLVMLSVGVSYLAAVYILHPEYYQDVIPLARDVYGAIGFLDDRVFGYFAIITSPFILFSIVLLLGRSIPEGTGLFASAVLAGVGLYFTQWKGFNYHTVPLEAFALAACFWVLSRSHRVTAIAATVTIGILGSGFWDYYQGMYRNPAMGFPQRVVNAGLQPQSVTSLSTHVFSGPPIALDLGADWGSRYAHLWPIPGALNALSDMDCSTNPERCAQYHAVLDHTRQSVIADLKVTRPDMLILDRDNPYITDTDFTWDDFMRNDPAWQTVMDDYRLAMIDSTYDVWIRCTQPTAAYAKKCGALSNESLPQPQ